MRAAVLANAGIRNLSVVDLPDPEPGPGEVLVRVRAVTLNYRDLLTVEGGYGSRQRTENLIPVSDGAGEVVATGGGVTRFATGDRVVANFFQRWQAGEPDEVGLHSGLGGLIDGMACELRVLPENGLCHTPAHLTDAEAAALPCAGLTAWSAVFDQGRIKPGDQLLTQGSGGVSVFALQFAKLAGAEVIATSSSDAKLQRLRELGANHLINYADTPEWARPAREISGGRGLDLVVEVGGARTLEQSVKAVRLGGAVMLVGVLSGANHDFRLPLVVTRKIRLEGVTCGSYEQFQAMLRAVEHNGLKPALDDRRFQLDELAAALEHLRAGAHFGKVVIEI
ncbi:MAG TPA: NAD(P)-dependent alcohol dehydrogenase [Rhodospirillaceae bacterium]|nr:NAD(P)-dependent alcohol dehydrogenase [Rhodospirillaceae bacterium]